MSINTEYKKLYQCEVGADVPNNIHIYMPLNDMHVFQALSHCCETCQTICSADCCINLGNLMRKNLLFYCYGEEEIVENFNNGLFSDLETAIIYAYKNRLPKRPALKDGLPGEVLLDLIMHIYEPSAYKLAVRTLLRQDDNNEIKGYDLTYFSVKDNKISIWLGQAKMGGKNYCKNGIHNDLLDKFKREYFSNQIYFIAEKQAGITKEGRAITNAINEINMRTIRSSKDTRADTLINYFIDNDIDINIPCLLAYGENSIYKNINEVSVGIEKEICQIKKYFLENQYFFDGFTPNILFFVFPIKDLEYLRSEGGFYHGLC